jgi:outer membrane protein
MTSFSRLCGALLVVSSLAALPCAAQTGASANNASHVRVASVDAKRILEESAPAKAAYEKIAAEFRPRQQALESQGQKLKAASDAFERDAPTLSESDRVARQKALSDLDRGFQRDQRAFSEDLNARKSQELSGLLDQTNRAIRKIAEAGGYDIVVQDAYYASPRVDITDQVLKELANPSAPAASGK